MFKIIEKQIDRLTTVKISTDVAISQDGDLVILDLDDILEIAEIIKKEKLSEMVRN